MKASRFFQVAAAAAVFVACAAPEIVGPAADDATQIRAAEGSPAILVECPTSQSFTESALVTPLGGVVSVAGMAISIPAGALLSDAIVTVTVPASRYVEVDISVAGAEHFLFALPVTVTLSYARCTRNDVNLAQLSAWYIDSRTKQPLEKMPSVDNKLLRTVTFTTDHLSGYAVAN